MTAAKQDIQEHIAPPADTPAGTVSFASVVKRDIRLAWAQGGAAVLGLAFLLMGASLFAFGIGPAPQLLARIAGGTLWVLTVLAVLLSLDRLYQADYEEGSLDDMALSPIGLGGIVLAKVTAHWLGTLLPLVLAAPFVGLLLNLEGRLMLPLLVSLLFATPALSLIGSIGAALTVAVRRGGVLLSLLVLPLYVPSLLFAMSAVEAFALGTDPLAHLALALAVSLLALVVAPFASVAALRLALD